MVSKISCTSCPNTSENMSLFITLSLELQGVDNIMDALAKHCGVEQLSEDELWNCDNCMIGLQGFKQFTVFDGPEVFIVGLMADRG